MSELSVASYLLAYNLRATSLPFLAVGEHVRTDGGHAGLGARSARVGGGETKERGEDDKREQHCLYNPQTRPRAQVLAAQRVDPEDALAHT